MASGSLSMPRFIQTPIAVVGLACRLPGNSNTPEALWQFLAAGGVAANKPPPTRFNLSGHYDGSKKPKTMTSPGGMFLENIDPRDIDAPFFGLSRAEAIAMDPQQRQTLEVVYEGLENAGISLQALDGEMFGCFVGSFASDYADMQSRDPDDRVHSVTVGVGRAMLSNRISHFLNIKGPSMTLDTACSGSLIAVDVACRYLQTREISGAIVAGCNLYLNPEHNMDKAMSGASSTTGKCHTFDAKAHGYIKSEAVNTIILKRLDDAINDGDPIRAVIRGSATNSNGWTAGIASPSSGAQAAAVRQAYFNANISDLNVTNYLEFHGTGTNAGDPIEVNGVASIFSATRSPDRPLIIGSIKSNVGHSEPAAGLSGLLKAILSLERAMIPGNPTYEKPNPQIDFDSLKLYVPKTSMKWPDVPYKRASINSFGYGGSNAHVILDDARSFLQRSTLNYATSFMTDDSDLFAEQECTRPFLLVFSANDEQSLMGYWLALKKHVINPNVDMKIRDLAFTLSERRTHHFHRAIFVTNNLNFKKQVLVSGKKKGDAPKIGFVFTGQGAQWSTMGKSFVESLPSARPLLMGLDKVLQSLPSPPSWSLLTELVEPRDPEHLRRPEFSQPLVTALQIVILESLKAWGIRPSSVVGHSSGEIAAAVAAGHITADEAIKVAYYRGQAASDCQHESTDFVGMLAAGLQSDEVQRYILDSEGLVHVACYNSPRSVTLSGRVCELEKVKVRLEEDHYFARLLQVDLAYHSPFMKKIANHYEKLLNKNRKRSHDCDAATLSNPTVTMFSSVSGHRIDQKCNGAYWKQNMIQPVRFEHAVKEMLAGSGAPDFLIEIGPSGALAGPITQIKKTLPDQGNNIEYFATSKRGPEAVKALFDVAGRVFIAGGSVNIRELNKDAEKIPAVIVDLPNYNWNHSIKYWHESEASKDWRFKQFIQHDLLGSKVLGTRWHNPSFKKVLRVQDLPWLADHKMGPDIVFPAAAYLAMAVEAIFQTSQSLNALEGGSQSKRTCYRLRDVMFTKALVLQDGGVEHKIMLILTPRQGTKALWHEFKISSLGDDIWTEHCHGLVSLEEHTEEGALEVAPKPLKHTTSAHLWYKAMETAGYSFGNLFQKQIEVESVAGKPYSRALLSLSEPPSAFEQSSYPMHPVCIDGCLQASAASLWNGHRSSVDTVLIPAMMDEVVIHTVVPQPKTGIAVSSAEYAGVGNTEEKKNYKSHVTVYDPTTGSMLFQVSGLHYHAIETRKEDHKSHTYTRVSWKPDITYLSQRGLHAIAMDTSSTSENQEDGSATIINRLVDMIAHKKPNLKVMELNMVPGEPKSIWLDGDCFDKSSRAACCQYFLTSNTARGLLDAQDKYGSGNTEISLLDLTQSPESLAPTETEFDLVIIKLIPFARNILENVFNNVRRVLGDRGSVLLLEQPAFSPNPDSDSPILVNGDVSRLLQIFRASGFRSTLEVPCDDEKSEFSAAYLSTVQDECSHEPDTGFRINLVHLSKETQTRSKIKYALKSLGWNISEHFLPFVNLEPKSTVLLLDEISSPILANIQGQEEQWLGIQRLFSLDSKVLWVTSGSQIDVIHPDRALINGLARVARAENPSLVVVTLDIEPCSNPDSALAIHELLKVTQLIGPKTPMDNEYTERRGIIHISRILPDEPMNQAEKDDTIGAQLQIRSLHESNTTIRLQSERLGTMDSLHFTEVTDIELPLPETFVEVEVYAAGLNFKDIAVTMGIVPENQCLLGLEGAGIIRRVGRRANAYQVGQRVIISRRGCFANRVLCPTDGVYPLPESMSFEEAATIGSVYLVSVYGLFNIGGLKKGHRVLIHSASGGVGIAAIQLCQHIGAEIFATVGTDEKRNFLIDNFAIPPDHIFSSRSRDFATSLMKATNCNGVDVILNSLTGHLLNESWLCIADGGTMVEIGKRDMLDRNSLSMVPFNRNASYRAVDMSHKSVPEPVVQRLLAEIFEFIAKGYIKPIAPMKIFPFEDIPAAFRYMRGGNHIGKIVISNGPDAEIQVPVRPASRKFILRQDRSYFIIGGLKGLCGSLATYLARHGAKHLLVMSRSGFEDEKSQKVLNDISALNSQIQLIQGDVTNPEDVQSAFNQVTKPIGGIIQGSMILRDKIYTSMTTDDFAKVCSPKVQGTWNLHNVSLKQSFPLDFFTCLSSLSGVVGQKGQSNYAAANVFLDSFCAYRHRLGLPACSIDLGVIEDVGYVSEREALAAQFDFNIWNGIDEKLLHKILRFSILRQISPMNLETGSQLITGIQVPQKDESPLLRDPRFSGLCFGDSMLRGGEGADSSRDVQAFMLLVKNKVDSPSLLPIAVDIVNKQFVKTLRLSEPMEPAKPLSGYGLDSLAAVEFRNWVWMELGTELTTLDITNAKSLLSLCEKIVGKVIESNY